MNRTLATATMLLITWSFAAAQAPADKQAEQELLKITREIIDATLRGDNSAFERYAADTYIETGSDGRVFSKSQVLALPTPATSLKPRLDLEDIRVHIYGDTAVVSYRGNYRAEEGGRQFSNSYRSTDIFIHRNGRWQVIDGHSSLIPAKRVAAKVDPKIYDAYSGRYEIAPGVVFTVTREGDKLMGQAAGEKTKTELTPENEITFSGEEERLIFVRDEGGQVSYVIFRALDGQESKARRIK